MTFKIGEEISLGCLTFFQVYIYWYKCGFFMNDSSGGIRMLRDLLPYVLFVNRILLKVSTIFDKGDNFWGFLLSEKGIYSMRKEFAPSGSKFFPNRLDAFSEGKEIALTEMSPPETVSVSL